MSDPEQYKSFSPFQINKGLSQNMDTVMFANEMNKSPWLDKKAQYAFLFNSINKKKRFSKWAKLEVLTNQSDIDEVSKFYNVSNAKATEYIKLIKPIELEYIKSRNDPGGCTIPKGKK